MKTLLRHYVIATFSLLAISKIAEGLYFGQGLKTLLLAGIAVMVVSIVAKPIINILLLPINLITFGLFRWVASSVIIYLATLIVPSFKVIGFYFAGISTKWLDIPTFNLHGIWSYVGFSFLLSLITSFIYWLIK